MLRNPALRLYVTVGVHLKPLTSMKESNNDSGCGGPIIFGIFTLIITLIKTGNIRQAIIAGLGTVVFVYILMRIF